MKSDLIPTLAAAAWRFEHPSALLLGLLVPVLLLLMAYSAARARRSLLLITGITPNQPQTSRKRQAVRIVLTAAGVTSLIIAIARPQSDPIEETVSVRGRDIVFLVDVSRSMLSRDVVPSRLGRTKIWINDLVNTLKGDRVALVAFAGVPVVKCPLTLDQNFFRMELDELSPASVPRGGTLIGDAIRKTMSAVFEPNPGRFRDIVLITDGEDQGSFPAEAAKAAAELGVRIIAIGIGSELEGAQVPAEGKDGYLVHEGSAVRSKMDGTTLAAIAQAASSVPGNGAGGVFLNVGTGTMDLDKVYHDLIASAEQRETESKASVTYKELFPMFLAAALALLTLDSLLPTHRRPARSSAATAPRALLGVLALMVATMLPTRSAWAQEQQPPPAKSADASPTSATPLETSPVVLYNAGRELYQAGDFAQAADRFRAADLAAGTPELSARTRFNLGMALLRQATAKPAPNQAAESPESVAIDPKQVLSQLEASVRAFRSSLEVNPGDDQAVRNVEIARRLMQQIREEQAKQQQQQQGKDGQKSDSKDQNGDPSKQQDQDQQGESAKDQEAKQRQEQADKLKDLAKQQSQAADKSKDAAEQSDPQKAQDASDASRQQQQDVNEQTKAQQEQMKKDSPEDAGSSKEALEKARKEQEAASKALEQNDPKSAQKHQEEAAKALEQAAQSEEKAAQEAREQAAQERQNQQAQKEAKEQAKQDKPKYDQSAAQALDKERKQREARQQVLRALRGRPVPVEKDW